MSARSNSHDFRILGNRQFEYYKNSTNLQDRKRYLEEAIKKYYRSFEEADNHEDRCSAAKNYGTAEFRLVEVLEEINSIGLPLILFHYKDAVTYLSKALVFGRLCSRSVDWSNQLMILYSNCVEKVLHHINTKLPMMERVQNIEQLIGAMSEDSQIAECYKTMTQDLFSAAVIALDAKDFKNALRFLHDCHRPIEECLRLSGSGDKKHIQEEAGLKKQEVLYALCTAEALQDIDKGDKYLDEAVNGQEDLDMNQVYDAMDAYRRAAINTRELEIEMEAVAMSRLGSLYEKVLKIKSKAREYYHQCMQLAMSLHPRTFTKESWFMQCSTTLQRYQRESIVDCEELEQDAKRKCREALHAEFKELKESDVGHDPSEFLLFLYKKFPPKNPQHTLNETKLDRPNWKKTLIRCVSHYHTDKQQEEVNGLEWLVLCEEITKRLNARIQCIKEETSV